MSGVEDFNRAAADAEALRCVRDAPSVRMNYYAAVVAGAAASIPSTNKAAISPRESCCPDPATRGQSPDPSYAAATQGVNSPDPKIENKNCTRGAKPKICGSKTVPTSNISAVASHVGEHAQRWGFGKTRVAVATNCALGLLVAGRGPARVPACEQTLRHVSDAAGKSTNVRSFRPLLLRALALFGPGELRGLRVPDASVVNLILSTLQAQQAGAVLAPSGATGPDDAAAGADRGPTAPAPLSPPLARALESLHVVSWPESQRGDAVGAFILIERCADSIGEVDCHFPARTRKNGFSPDQVIARCTQLESLTHASRYASPASWLGLSQLHTLRGVDLNVVSAADIAAALPRLHTLDVTYRHTGSSPHAINGFFEVLLPRLRVLHMSGFWPRNHPSLVSETVAPLPLLQEVHWNCSEFNAGVARRFMGAHPLRVRACCRMIFEWLDADSLGSDPLARCREVLVAVDDDHLHGWNKQELTPQWRAQIANHGTVAFDGRKFARLLHGAPQLRALTLVAGTWLAAATGLDEETSATFGKVTHSWLRCIRLVHSYWYPTPFQMTEACAARLRQRHFPRLQFVTVDSSAFSAAPPDGKSNRR